MTDAQIEAAAAAAKADQLTDMQRAKSPLEAYWAGSASASVMRHYQRGAVRTVRAK